MKILIIMSWIVFLFFGRIVISMISCIGCSILAVKYTENPLIVIIAAMAGYAIAMLALSKETKLEKAVFDSPFLK